jgi:hypothetical protein
VAVIAGCTDAIEADAPIGETIDVRRIGARVEVRRVPGDAGRAEPASAGDVIDVEVGARVVLTATLGDRSITIATAATAPGVPITASVFAEVPGQAPVALEIRNDLVVLGDTTYRLGTWRERDAVVTALAAGPLAGELRALAPYRAAIEAHLAEAAPVFVAVGLFQAWPDGVEPPWPALEDPRDRDPPGQLPDDVAGLGMTCSTAIRCPSSAPYCVTLDHEVTFGVCTRACASDAACGAGGRCTQSVIDIPDVAGSVLTCAIDCTADACPGLLACASVALVCEASQDHATGDASSGTQADAHGVSGVQRGGRIADR